LGVDENFLRISNLTLQEAKDLVKWLLYLRYRERYKDESENGGNEAPIA
jgi:hypothetical protein